MTATLVPLISGPDVGAAAADRQSLRQVAAGKPIPQPLPTHQAPRPASVPTLALIYSHPLARLSMTTVEAFRASTLPVQQWTTVVQKGKTITVAGVPTSERGNTVERYIAAEHPRLVREPLVIERRILFPSRARATPKDHRDMLKIAYKLKMTLSAAKVPTHICFHRQNYNEKGNLSSQMAPTNISSMLLSQHQKMVLRVVRQLDQDITNATRDKR